MVPLETAEMKAEKIDKSLKKGDENFVPQRNGSLGSFGLNLELYLERAATPEERLARLEQAVIAMHKDLKVMAPVVQNMTDASQPQPSPYAAPIMPEAVYDEIDADAPPVMLKKQKAQKPAANQDIDRVIQTLGNPSAPMVTSVRTGKHPSVTRLVFDVTKQAPYSVDLDDQEHILVVEFPAANWNPQAMSQNFPKDKLLKSYKVSNVNNDGKIFALQLRKSSKVVKQMVLPSLSGSGKRIVIDLAE